MASWTQPPMHEDRPDPDMTIGFDVRPSLLLISSIEPDPAFLQLIAQSGFRLTDVVPASDAGERLKLVVGTDVLMLDTRGSTDMPELLEVLVAIRSWSALGDADLLAVADISGIDPIVAELQIDIDSILCDPSPIELTTFFCLRSLDQRPAYELHDIGREPESARIDKLSEDVRRLIRTIEQLTHNERTERSPPALRQPQLGYAAPPAAFATPESGAGVTRHEVRAALQARRMRDRYLPADLFADPAWDMILDLLAARLDGKRVSVSSLCIAAAVPPTTALRWISQLVKRGICLRRNDPADARRVFISLSDEAAENVIAWFAAIKGTMRRQVDG